MLQLNFKICFQHLTISVLTNNKKMWKKEKNDIEKLLAFIH